MIPYKLPFNFCLDLEQSHGIQNFNQLNRNLKIVNTV